MAVAGSIVERKWEGCRCASPGIITEKARGEVVRRYCVICRYDVKPASAMPSGPAIHYPIGAIVEQARGHLKNYRRGIARY